jgi:hypothetical protein
MNDKEEQQTTHIYLDGMAISRELGEELVFVPAGSKLKEALTEADLMWLTDEIGKRLANRMRSSMISHMGIRA